jgi:hypothetical protein
MPPEARRFEVVVLRRNGRLLRYRDGLSKYAAKQQKTKWEEKYEGQPFSIEIRPPIGDDTNAS